MKKDRRTGASLAAAILVFGILLIAPAQDTAQQSPTLNVPLSVTAGQPLVGDASDGGGMVVVEVLCEGAPLPGSPDTLMEGDVNRFDIQVPAWCAGKTLEVIARALDGRETVKYVHVPN